MKRALILLAALAMVMAAGAAKAEQSAYVPAYSHIYYGDKPSKILLTTTLSIRNTDPDRNMKVNKVEYRSDKGKVLKTFVNVPVTIQPLASVRYVVPETDEAGGSGASFSVTWSADKNLNPPVIQAVMIGATANQGISFVCEAVPMPTLK